ncbi:uncharacterized protein LOC122722096 [Manihot esculenta]|uniref:uncharacterized protein LOC122722096 n=1 Tax=Manihot esculenta TaxID=3983 RepID=UPI001CC4BB06|nr:uncharacterized protein LOC122722096 [Manihot esculenta]
MGSAIFKKAFRMYVTGYNRGLREARHAPDIPLEKLRKPELDSDGEPVLYGEDDFPMPRGDCRIVGRSSVSSSEESESEGEDEEVPGSEGDDPNSEKEDPHLGSEIAPVVNVERPDPKEAVLPPDVAVNKDSVGEDVLTDVSPLRTIFPSTSSEK